MLDLRMVKDFEERLDRWLKTRPGLTFKGDSSLQDACHLIEFAYDARMAEPLERGLDVLAPYWVCQKDGLTPDVEGLIQELTIASHYYYLRDYLYYTYNAPGSMQWDFGDNSVRISFLDRSIPRQFFITGNNHLLGSFETFQGKRETAQEIRRLLRGRSEFELAGRSQRALELIEAEADLKLHHNYNFLRPDDELSLGAFTYREFYLIYRSLLIKGLYHRYYGQANTISSPVIFSFSELADELQDLTGVAAKTANDILTSITYSATNRRIHPMYFGLFALGDSGQFVMPLHRFTLWEGLINIFRMTALRTPSLFTTEINPKLSDGFLEHVRSLFKAPWFSASANVELKKYDSSLPDIDLLVTARVPGFGHTVFVCEVKNPIPPMWAKDQLRVLNQDSVSKAFKQLAKIRGFLGSQVGLEFLRSRFSLSTGAGNQSDSDVIAVKYMVITSANTGMLFSDEEFRVIDYHTLTRILRRGKGDSAHFLNALVQLDSWADRCLELRTAELDMDGFKVRYEGVTGGKLLDFDPAPRPPFKAGRNDLCPCGSGRKYKRCCG